MVPGRIDQVDQPRRKETVESKLPRAELRIKQLNLISEHLFVYLLDLILRLSHQCSKYVHMEEKCVPSFASSAPRIVLLSQAINATHKTSIGWRGEEENAQVDPATSDRSRNDR